MAMIAIGTTVAFYYAAANAIALVHPSKAGAIGIGGLAKTADKLTDFVLFRKLRSSFR
jgi:hypothetical protein